MNNVWNGGFQPSPPPSDRGIHLKAKTPHPSTDGSWKSQAIQLWRMWKIIRTHDNFTTAQARPCWNSSIQMSSVSSWLHRQSIPEETRTEDTQSSHSWRNLQGDVRCVAEAKSGHWFIWSGGRYRGPGKSSRFGVYESSCLPIQIIIL